MFLRLAADQAEVVFVQLGLAALAELEYVALQDLIDSRHEGSHVDAVTPPPWAHITAPVKGDKHDSDVLNRGRYYSEYILNGIRE